jgi:hypothetical protein
MESEFVDDAIEIRLLRAWRTLSESERAVMLAAIDGVVQRHTKRAG